MNFEMCRCDSGEYSSVGEHMQVSTEGWLVEAPVNNDTVRCSTWLRFTSIMVQ
jgi:hypothetical protein